MRDRKILEYRKTYREMSNPVNKPDVEPPKEPESLNEAYIEVMGPDFDKGVGLIKDAFNKWAAGPATERSDIKPARKEVLKWIEKQIS